MQQAFNNLIRQFKGKMPNPASIFSYQCTGRNIVGSTQKIPHNCLCFLSVCAWRAKCTMGLTAMYNGSNCFFIP